MKSQIVIFEGNKKDGIFSYARKFYPENYTDEEIFTSVKNSRINLGNKYNFSGLKMFQTTQKMEDNEAYLDNKAVIIDEKYMKNDDYFTERINADILIITNKYKNVVLCHRMGDCPILIAEDRKNGVSAIVHCNIYHINRGLPKELINSLINNFNSDPRNIYLYIGSHIKKESYIYDRYPSKATNKSIWKDAIEEKNNKFYIDIDKAILNQLKEFDLGNIEISTIDTAKHPDYASHKESSLGNKNKLGQNIVGFYYK